MKVDPSANKAMHFKNNSQLGIGWAAVTVAPLIDIIFLVAFFFMLSSYFTVQPGILVKLPKTMTSDMLKASNLVISITNENIIYINNKVTNISDLKSELSSVARQRHPVLIQADRRASVGRIVDVWDICRALGIDQINIATTQRK